MELAFEIAFGIILAYIILSLSAVVLSAAVELWDAYRTQITLIAFGLVILFLIYGSCDSTPVANRAR